MYVVILVVIFAERDLVTAYSQFFIMCLKRYSSYDVTEFREEFMENNSTLIIYDTLYDNSV